MRRLWFSVPTCACCLLAASPVMADGMLSAGLNCEGNTPADRANTSYNDYGAFNESTSAQVVLYCDAPKNASTSVGNFTTYVYDRDSTSFVKVEICYSDVDGFSRNCYAYSTGTAFVGGIQGLATPVGPEDFRVYLKVTLPKKTASGNSIITFYNYTW